MDIRRIFITKANASSGSSSITPTESSNIRGEDVNTTTQAAVEKEEDPSAGFHATSSAKERPSDLGIDTPMQHKFHPAAYLQSVIGKTVVSTLGGSRNGNGSNTVSVKMLHSAFPATSSPSWVSQFPSV